MKKRPVYIIAEAGVNHNGSLRIARRLIEAAAHAGADAVKFQSFKASRLLTRLAPKADYQRHTTDISESQYDMIKMLELDETTHKNLIRHCQKLGIQFLSTPFDLDSLDLLAHRLDLPLLKLPSGEITNAPLLLKSASSGKPIILSTGMATMEEIETALGILSFGYRRLEKRPSIGAFKASYRSKEGKKILLNKVTLLHCTSEYPAPVSEVNLRAMDTLKQTFGLPTGYSDHTAGITVPIAAAALGAVVIEKHFTLDRSFPGPDHHASLEPIELEEMIRSVRQVEEALGSFHKKPTPAEIKNIPSVRKSIVAARKIKRGEIFSENNLTAKRPGNGKSPIYFWELIGKAAEKNYTRDELITQ